MRNPVSLFLLVVLISTQVRADSGALDWLSQYKKPNLHVGQLALHPYYKLSEIYDSNIYLVPHDLPSGQVGGGVKSSWITRNNLGIEADLPWRHINDLSVGYDFTADAYTTEPSVNNTINQAVHADFTRAGSQGVTYRAGDQYVNTTDQAFSELIRRERRWMNRIYGEVDYRPEHGRLAGGVDASQQTDKYLDPVFAAALNRYEDRVGFNVGYMVQPKTKAYVSYHRGIIHYGVIPPPGQTDKNSKSHTVAGGVDGQLAPKVEGQVEAGMTYREYDEAPISGAPRVRRASVVSTKVTYKADAYTTAVLSLTRSLEESIDPSNPFYYSNTAALDLNHKFPYKFSAGVDLLLGKDQYLNAQSFSGTTGNRRDDIYQGGIWVEYDIQQWISTGLSYVYRERDSTFSGQFNYQDNITAWNVALKF